MGNDEEAWVNDPFALLAPPRKLRYWSPFARGLSPAARLNAHARLTILIGLGVTLLMRKDANAPLAVFLTVLWVISQGVDYVVEEEAREKELSSGLGKQNAAMGDDPSRVNQYVPPNMSRRNYEAHIPARPNPANQVGGTFQAPPLGNGMSDPSVEQPVINNPASLISQRQSKYSMMNYHLSRAPTRFDVQNQALPIGGQAPAMSSQHQVQQDLGRVHPNPGPFDYGTAVNSLNPQAYTYEANHIQRMMQPVDMVDPGLVTHPIADPTFMARMPTFDKSDEYEAEQRWRMQRASGSMRFW